MRSLEAVTTNHGSRSVTDKAPFFLNLPYTTTLYTHDTGTVIHTYSVTDLDPQDVDSLTVTKTAGDVAFVLDTGARKSLWFVFGKYR